jgi:hypothetical protein
MSEVYAARSVARKHIVEQCGNCKLKKNNNGLYNHDNIVKVQETIEGKLNKVFLDHNSGLEMIKLLDSTDNEINYLIRSLPPKYVLDSPRPVRWKNFIVWRQINATTTG